MSAQAFDDADRAWMARALELAERGLCSTTPNPRVGCVLVRDGRSIGEGFTQPAGQGHAEVQALADCAAHGRDARAATAYVSLEPCSHFGRTPPCVDALIAAGVARVVAAIEDPNPQVAGAGLARLAAAGVAVQVGLLAEAAREINIGFFSRMQRGRPWVRLKMAATLDGRTALADGRSRWITGPEARRDGHAWRARACAVATGIGTVCADDPELTVRLVDAVRQPLRVVVDARGETPASSRALGPGRVLVITAGTSSTAPAWPAHVETMACPGTDGRVDLPAMLLELGRREINELHVEAGRRLSGALLAAGLVDELLLYLAPSLLGESAAGMFTLPAIASLDQRVRLSIIEVQRIGDDLRVRARVESPRRE